MGIPFRQPSLHSDPPCDISAGGAVNLAVSTGATTGAVNHHRSVMLDRLLDSVDVAVEPITTRGPTPAASEVPEAGVLSLAGGAKVYFTAHHVAIVPPSPRPGASTWEDRGAYREAPIVNTGTRIRVTYQGGNLFDHLPQPVAAPLTRASGSWRCLRELVEELATVRPGRCTMIAALLRQLLVLVLRRHPVQAGLLTCMAAREDPRLGRAVHAMQGAPEHAFTLPELADVAGMSRSVFAAHFASVLAQPPIQYLKTLRLSRAATLLRRTDLPIKVVASQVGYSSRSSFTRAFIAHHGVAPHGFRAAVTASVP
jgi:AraC-like DNA-binding protein